MADQDQHTRDDDPRSSGTGTARAQDTQRPSLRLAVRENNREQITLVTQDAPPPTGYRFAREHEIRDVLEMLPAPALRNLIFEACSETPAERL